MLTVITPATNIRLTTVATVKAELGITGTSDDAWIDDTIDRASDTITRYCNRSFAAETVREVVYLDRPTEALLCSRFPVAAVIEIGAGSTMNGAFGYEIERETGLLHSLNSTTVDRIPWPAGKITVNYTSGYVLPGDDGRDLPHDVERAAILLVKAAYFARTRDPLIKSETVPDALQSSYWMGDLPPEVEGILSRWRVVAL